MIEEVEADRESVRVYQWRVDWLRHGGFTKRNASLLAASDIDWHYAARILKQCKAKGYDEEFVMRLLHD